MSMPATQAKLRQEHADEMVVAARHVGTIVDHHRRVGRCRPRAGAKRAAGMILSAHDPAALPLASMAGNSERQYCNRQRDARPIVRTTAAWCLLQ